MMSSAGLVNDDNVRQSSSILLKSGKTNAAMVGNCSLLEKANVQNQADVLDDLIDRLRGQI